MNDIAMRFAHVYTVGSIKGVEYEVPMSGALVQISIGAFRTRRTWIESIFVFQVVK
jgi:hypothetical protein